MLKLRVYVESEEKERMFVAMIAQGRVPESSYTLEVGHVSQTGRFHWGKAFWGVTAWCAHLQLVQKACIPVSHVSQ